MEKIPLRYLFLMTSTYPNPTDDHSVYLVSSPDYAAGLVSDILSGPPQSMITYTAVASQQMHRASLLGWDLSLPFDEHLHVQIIGLN